MSLSTALAFAAAFLVLAVSPGPGVATIVGRALHGGVAAGLAAATGLIIGDFLFIGFALAGLSALASTMGPIFEVVKYAGAAYLVWLGWRALTAPAVPLQVDAAAERLPLWRDIGLGLLVTLGNPKPILFYGALLPTFVDVATATWRDGMILGGIVVLISYVVLGGYSVLAARARSTFTSSKAMKRLNTSTGVVMIGAGVAVATR
jgi:threonine/homoserine/homoserine lactone efflux protein